MTGDGIAIDWGTTNCRAYRIDAAGLVTDRIDQGAGVAAMARADYPAAIAAIRARLGDLPVLAAGMVGSTRGWMEAPYVPAPAGLAEIAAGLLPVADGVRLVPGLAQDGAGHPDVMRGEEVQVLGAVAGGQMPPDALVVQPGTHAKWVTVTAGRIAGWRTRMTGELFALLRDASILTEMMAAPAAPGAAFAEGVERRGVDLLGALFEVRASVLLGRRDAADGASFASGLLIGAEIAAAFAEGGPRDIYLLSEGTLGLLYAAGIAAAGGRAHRIDSHAAFVAGIHHLRELA